MKILLALIASILIIACSDNNSGAIEVAGNTGVETENTIAGIVMLGDTPSQGASVSLLPSDYNPVAGGEVMTATTDEEGKYSFTPKSTGQYNIFMKSPTENHRSIIKELEFTVGKDSTYQAGSSALKEPASLKLSITGAKAGEHIYIPGTLVKKEVTSEDIKSGTITVQDIPAATYKDIIHTGPETGPVDLVNDSVALEPGKALIRIATSSIVDNNDKAVKYTGSWIYATNGTGTGVYLNEDAHYTNEKGASFELTFTGHGIEWFGLKNRDLGYANIYIDGEKVAEVEAWDFFSNRRVARLYQNHDLVQGQHTIRIEVAGKKEAESLGTFVVHDYFKIWTY